MKQPLFAITRKRRLSKTKAIGRPKVPPFPEPSRRHMSKKASGASQGWAPLSSRPHRRAEEEQEPRRSPGADLRGTPVPYGGLGIGGVEAYKCKIRAKSFNRLQP